MRFELLSLVAASTAFAAGPPGGPPSGQCLTSSDASYLVNGYVNHIAQNYNDTIAQKLVADGTNVTSQSVLALMGKTGNALQGVTFQGKQAVLNGEKNKAGTLTIKLLNIDAVGCTSIGWRWLGTPNGGTPVRAISIFDAVYSQANGWQISDIYGEFNSLTWGEDVGANCTLPPPPPSS